jgi:uncharacterized membrane protein required for colicin V production
VIVTQGDYAAVVAHKICENPYNDFVIQDGLVQDGVKVINDYSILGVCIGVVLGLGVMPLVYCIWLKITESKSKQDKVKEIYMVGVEEEDKSLPHDLKPRI